MALETHTLAPAGSTATGAYASVAVPANYDAIGFQINSTAGGTSATLTFQGSLDGVNWFDVAYVTDATDTAAVAGRTLNPSSSLVQWLSNPVARKYAFFRLNVSANTGITFSATLYQIIS